MKRKTYLWIVGLLVIAALCMLLNFEENLDKELKYVAKQTEKPPKQKESTYLNLPLSEEDKTNIYQLLEPLANWSLISLGFNRKEIEARGHATKGIPILRYLAYVKTNPELLKFVVKIRSRSKIWKPFQAGFVKGLEKSDAAGEIRPYLKSFAKDVHLDYQVLLEMAEKGDWEAFLSNVWYK
ncbi:MAG: hypothetical protein KDK44_01440 [Chlamydiia bacterium]|nr:hypothetical protein [Chlamydiia bacterium]MCP5509379.1 hypothetical protein [Chlamydiales bacterium]HPE84601.1 hypothetical protein [Chlamydiales bacterium]